ncbi:beta-tubulin cofactor C [Planoprotostelium fungivorum]|uniref:Beta-tubulin cofactor C n=1 Tax=Planoprotostelium fungivorum TaxID=1890364 RepID=A0A2P6MTF1_9EUKA|nr:beta-tubulin cofactor C [Planoprotostelium fungivorum]
MTTETQQRVQKFASEFTTHKENVNSLITKASSVEKDQLNSHFEEIYSNINVANKLLKECLNFLPLYEINQAQKTLKQLEEETSKTKDKLIPKEKFSFKNRKKVETTTQKEKPKIEEQKFTRDRPNDDTSVSRGEDNRICNLRDEKLNLTSKHYDTLHIFNLEGCQLYCGAISGSILIENCNRCTFVFGARQVRIHTSKSVDFYIFVKSSPIIEFCENIRVAPYNLQFEGREEQFEKAAFVEQENKWDQMEDFNWLKAAPSPNWSVIPEAERSHHAFE